jgi:hypothetical protein
LAAVSGYPGAWDVAQGDRGSILLHGPRVYDRQALQEFADALAHGEMLVVAGGRPVPQEFWRASWQFVPATGRLESLPPVGPAYLNPVVISAPAPVVAPAASPRGADTSGPLSTQVAAVSPAPFASTDGVIARRRGRPPRARTVIEAAIDRDLDNGTVTEAKLTGQDEAMARHYGTNRATYCRARDAVLERRQRDQNGKN